MKKLLALVFALLMMGTLAACSGSNGPLHAFIGDENAAAISETAPVKITVIEDNGGEQKKAVIRNEEDIAALVEKFVAITVGKDTEIEVTDNYNCIILTWSDGSETVITLNADTLEFENENGLGHYKLNGLEEFWTEAFELGSKEPETTPSAMNNIVLKTYDNGLFKMNIPDGWTVDVWGDVDFIHYTFRAYNPEDPRYQIFFNMKTEGYLISEQERIAYNNMYPGTPMGMLPAIDPTNTEGFYRILSRAMSIAAPHHTFLTINNFTVVENIGTNITGGDILRATFIDEYNNKMDGIFTATVAPVPIYVFTACNVYTTVFFTTPENELVEWEDILNTCTGSIEFSQTFITQFGNQEATLARQIAENARICNAMTDIITSGWQQRQSTYDIISQKQSDATLGYERVYDTDTGEVYKAYNGFSDDYSGTRYQPVTDDMYNLPIDGYIE